MIERSASSKRGKTVSVGLIIINLALSFSFFLIMYHQGYEKWTPRITEDFANGNVFGILYFMNVFMLTAFYTGLLVMFAGILFSVIRLVKQYDAETYNLTKVSLWACLVFYLMLMTFRVLIFVGLRFNPLHQKRLTEVIFYGSEVLLIGLVIYVVWRNKNENEDEEAESDQVPAGSVILEEENKAFTTTNHEYEPVTTLEPVDTIHYPRESKGSLFIKAMEEKDAFEFPESPVIPTNVINASMVPTQVKQSMEGIRDSIRSLRMSERESSMPFSG